MCFPIERATEKEWEFAGLKCVVTGGDHQGRCGYVRVPPSHPALGKEYDELEVEVHGGLTFGAAEPCEHEDGRGFWFGFDCAHLGDGDVLWEPGFEPEVLRRYSFSKGHFWSLAEVAEETERLAKQLAEMKTRRNNEQ